MTGTAKEAVVALFLSYESLSEYDTECFCPIIYTLGTHIIFITINWKPRAKTVWYGYKYGLTGKIYQCNYRSTPF